jgi:mannan endo-1,4-beta-mannosidase
VKVSVLGTSALLAIGFVSYVVIQAPSSNVSEPPTQTSVTARAFPIKGVTVQTTKGHRAHPAVQLHGDARRRPVIGVTVPGIAKLDRFVTATRTAPGFVGVFEDWARNRQFPRELADAVAARGSRLSITWEPWNSHVGTADQPRYSLSSIISGKHDSYIDSYARAVKRYVHPVNIRLMHEMNGFWYPWARGVNGNKPGQYVEAWRHIHDRFARLGVTNVRWMWAPNAVFPGAGHLAELYPGRRYVDRVGIDDYNWGNRTHDGVRTHWQSFRSLFQPTINRLRHISHQPLWISEVGSLGRGGSQAAWIGAMFAHLRHSSTITGLMWFDIDDYHHHADWRIEGHPAAAQAWARGFWNRR